MLVVVVRLDGKPRWPLFTVLNLLVHEVYATVTARLLWNRGWLPRWLYILFAVSGPGRLEWEPASSHCRGTFSLGGVTFPDAKKRLGVRLANNRWLQRDSMIQTTNAHVFSSRRSTRSF